MPNEQTSVPLYAASEVLTAANMNISAGTGVPVFATTVTRDAAFGGANEKVLAEGQLCYLSSTNVVQYYDGAAWATVGPAAAATSGLVCVKAETAFSAVSSVTADGVFTSTYTNYKVIVRFTTTLADLGMQFGVASTYTATNYNYQQFRGQDSTASATRSSSQTSAIIADSSSGSFFSLCTIDISGVQLAEPTNFVALNGKSAGAYTSPSAVNLFGNQSASTAFDGIKFLVSSGTTTGSYTIYGYSKTV